MNRIRTLCSGLIVVLQLLACNRDQHTTPQFPPIANDGEPRIIWKEEISEIPSRSIPLHRHNDEIVFSFEENSGSERFQKRSMDSGSLTWESEPYDYLSKDEASHSADDSRIYQYTSSGIIGIDLNTGQEDWRVEEARVPHKFELGNNVYGVDQISKKSSDATILKINSQTGVVDSLFSVSSTNYRFPQVRSLSGFIDYRGMEILIAAVNMGAFQSSNREVVDVYCYNVTQDTLMWKTESIQGAPLFGYFLSVWSNPQIDVENNLIYFQFNKAMICMNIRDGSVVWDTFFPNSFMSISNQIIYEDKLIFHEDFNSLTALDRFTGELIYRSQIGYLNTERLDVWNDNIVYVQDNIKLVDPSTGEVWRELKVSDSPWSNQEVSMPYFDDDNKRMYYYDGFAIICAEIPDTWYE